MTTIAVFGATGRTGRAFIELALARGAAVAAYARRGSMLRGLGGPVRIVEGGIDDEARISEAVSGSDAVVIALGPRQDSPAAICAPATERIVAAMKMLQVRRLLCVTGALVGEAYPSRGRFYRILRTILVTRIPWLMHDRDEQERIVRLSGLDWTIFKPPRLADGASLPSKLGTDLPIGLFARTTVGSLACEMLQEIRDPRFIGKAVFILS